jgi:hypothetical protein
MHLPLSFVLADQLPAVIPNRSPARNPSSLFGYGVPHPQLHRGWGLSATPSSLISPFVGALGQSLCDCISIDAPGLCLYPSPFPAPL